MSTENEETTTTAPDTGTQPSPPQPEPEAADVANPEAAKASREAARYRTRAKELEGELEQARAQLSSTRRSVIESYNASTQAAHRLLADALGDQLDGGLDVDQFFDDHGFNPQAFDQWAKATIDKHSYMSAIRTPILPDQGKVPQDDYRTGDPFAGAVMGAI